MNDVLPKPFTKEGLLNMLEKHLSHLKKQPPGIESMGAPPQPGPLSSAKRSMKSEDSPATSPATVSNWNSPGGLAIVSPSGSTHPDDPYMHGVHNHTGPGQGPYPAQAPMAPAQMYSTSPGGPMGAPSAPLRGSSVQSGPSGPPTPQRRGIADISGGVGDVGGDLKRQMYAPPVPGGQQMPSQMQRPPGR